MPRGGGQGGGNEPQKGMTGFQSKDVSLTVEEQHQVARWLGEFYAPMRIPDLVKERYGKVVSAEYAYSFQKRQKWQGLIDRYRQEWLIRLGDVPAANQKYRLEKIQDLIRRLDLAHEGQSVAAGRYETRMLRLLNQARLEMEESTVNQTFYFTNINNSLSDEELLKRRTELLKRIQDFKLPARRTRDGLGYRREVIEATTGDSEEDGGGIQEVRDGEGDGSVVA